MKRHHQILAGFAMIVALLCAPDVSAQIPFRIFGSKTPEKGTPAKSPIPEMRRVKEINVEIAWLADPITFPYYLEANVGPNQQLDVRGYVPNKAVREYALRIAQVYSSLPVTDSMKEHPSLLVRPSQMAPQQLQSSVQASLRAALPKQYKEFKVECAADGKVFVLGPVNTFEERIAVSHSLRRLHGCTSVQNLTTVPEELARAVANPPRDMGIAQVPKKTPLPIAKGPTTKEPPLADPQRKSDGPRLVGGDRSGDGSRLIPPIGRNQGPDLGLKEGPDVIKVQAPAKGMTIADLEKRILAVCPQAKKVEATLTSAKDLRILIDARAASDINPIAERIFAMPELQNYRPELQFRVAP